MNRRLVLASMSLLAIAACGREEPTGGSAHERALQVWDDNLKAVERLVETEAGTGNVSPELLRIDDFFRRVTGRSGLLVAHYTEDVTLSPQAESAIRQWREWCDQNCDRLSIDPENGQVIVLPASEPAGDRPSNPSVGGP